MLFFLVPRRYRPIALVVLGVFWLVLGIAVLGRVSTVVGCVLVVLGLASGVARLRGGAQAGAEDADRWR